MSAVPDKGAARILTLPASGDFDDIGALVAAIRHMLDGAGPIAPDDSRHLYVLAVMAEVAWRRLDDAMTGKTK